LFSVAVLCVLCASVVNRLSRPPFHSGDARSLLGVERVFLAEALIGVNDRSGALDTLEESARFREPDLLWKLSYGHFARLRGNPRYAALIRRVGVSEHMP
jgi:hypothetical protein